MRKMSIIVPLTSVLLQVSKLTSMCTIVKYYHTSRYSIGNVNFFISKINMATDVETVRMSKKNIFIY